MTAANLTTNTNIEVTIAQFFEASAQTRLVVLHYVARKIHRASKSAKPGAFFSQKVQNVLKEIQQLPKEERHEALEEILYGIPTRLSDAYSELDANMKMAFWYRLATSRRSDVFLSNIHVAAWNQEQHVLLADLETRDSNELMSFLRAVAADEAAVAIA